MKSKNAVTNFPFIILEILLLATLISAQVTFTPTPNTLGITTQVGTYGVAWGDYNNDGYLDLFQPGSSNPGVLYRSNAGSLFVDVSAQGVLVDSTGDPAYGAIWADLDNDGDLDLLNCDQGLKLYRNDGETFHDATADAGLDTIAAGEPLWMVAAGDYDRDGDLDLAFAGSDQGIGGSAMPVHLLKNDNMVFTDVSDSVFDTRPVLETWNPMWLDVDTDGDLDLWMPTIRTDHPCALFINENGTLVLSDPTSTGLNAVSAIASDWADYDNDGDFDLFLIPFVNDDNTGAKFFRNNGDLTFTNIAADLGLDATFSESRGVLWADYDNDGDTDLLITIRSNQHQLYRNDNGNFVRADQECNIPSGSNTRQFQFIDYDNDGFLDLYLGEQNGPKTLLHNDGNGNHYIKINPVGLNNNKDGIGVLIRIVVDSTTQIRQIQASGGGMSNGYLNAHFGLDTATVIDSLIIYWPDGSEDLFLDVSADQDYTLIEGTGDIVSKVFKKEILLKEFELLQNYPNPFNPNTTIEFSLQKPMHIELVLLNTLGQKVKVIASGFFNSGIHRVNLEASDLASGIYFYRLSSEGYSQIRKMVLLK